MTYRVYLTWPAQPSSNTIVAKIDLSDITDAAWWAQVAAGGANIRIRAGATELPRDVAVIDTTAKTGLVFFRCTLGTTATTITVEAFSGAPAPAVTDPNGRNAVWQDWDDFAIPSVDFANGLTVPVDRTGNGTFSIIGTTPPTLTVDGLTFGSTCNGYAKITGLPTRTVWTMSTRARQNVNDNTSARAYISYGTNDASDITRETLLATIFTANNYQLNNSTDGNLVPSVFPGGLINTWNRWDCWHNNTSGRGVYANGLDVGNTGSSAVRPTGGNTHFIGVEDTSANSIFRGDQDYFGMRNGIPTPDALLLQNNLFHGPRQYEITAELQSGYVIQTETAIGILDETGQPLFAE